MAQQQQISEASYAYGARYVCVHHARLIERSHSGEVRRGVREIAPKGATCAACTEGAAS